MRLLTVSLSIIIMLFAAACKCKKNSSSASPATTTNSTNQDPSIKGDMKPNSATQPRNFIAEGYTKGVIKDKRGLDGCTFLIELEDKSFMQPTNLTENFLEDNKKVWFKYSLKKGAMGTCMSGKIIELTDIVDRWYD